MQNEEQQLIVSIRIKENGVTNAMIAEMLSYNNRKISYLREEQSLKNLDLVLKNTMKELQS
jgi:hypothetical protein